jgi:hypothetical protein
MKMTLTNLKFPAIMSFLLVLPFLFLELGNRRNLFESFPIALFGVLWLLSMVFFILLMPIVRTIQTGNGLQVNPVLLVRVVVLILLAVVWVSMVNDQIPCFLGIPNCD